MASFEQDFIIFEDDTLLLRYTFTDLEGTFTGTEAVWWGAWDYNDWTGSTGTIATYKADNWTGTTPSPPSDTNNINVVSGDVIVNVYFEQDDFDASTGPLDTDTEYYTELVISDDTSENNSVVAATGKLFVSRSMFSAAGFRPS